MRKILFIVLMLVAAQTAVHACNDCGGILRAEPSEAIRVKRQYKTSTADLFSSPELSLDEYMRQEVLNRNTDINLTNYNLYVDDLERYINSFMALNGDLPLAVDSYSYSYKPNDSKPNTVSHVNLPYIYDTVDEHKEKTAKMNKLIDDIVLYANQANSDAGKILLAHDKIAYDYSYEGIDKLSHTAYSFLERGTGVCQGYTYLYHQVLKRLGISSGIYSSDEANHMWSCITLDGKSYHSDVTWDDPILQGTWSEQEKKEFTRHSYLFFTDEKAQELTLNKATGNYAPAHGSKSGWEIYGYDSIPDCNDKKYESGFIFTDCLSSIRYENGAFVFIIKNTEFTKKSIKSSGAYITDLRYNKISNRCYVDIKIPVSFSGTSRIAVAIYDSDGKLTEVLSTNGTNTSSTYSLIAKSLPSGGTIKAMNLSGDLITPLSEVAETYIQ